MNMIIEKSLRLYDPKSISTRWASFKDAESTEEDLVTSNSLKECPNWPLSSKDKEELVEGRRNKGDN